MVIGVTAGSARRLATTDTAEIFPLISATMGMVTRSAAMATARQRARISGTTIRPNLTRASARNSSGCSATIPAVATTDKANP